MAAPSAGPAAAPLTTQDGKAGGISPAPPPAANPDAAVPKPSQTVHAAHFSPNTYLETEAEIDAYLAALKTKLIAIVHAGQRVRIQ